MQLADGRDDRASLSAITVAAHEVGHAEQHRDEPLAWRATGTLGPAALIADFAAIPLIGLSLSTTWSWISPLLTGIALLLAVSGLVRLVVEVDASRRAMGYLAPLGLTRKQRRRARRLLIACGATYLAEALFDVGWFSRRWSDTMEEAAGGAGPD